MQSQPLEYTPTLFLRAGVSLLHSSRLLRYTSPAFHRRGGWIKGYEETSQTERIVEDERGAKAFQSFKAGFPRWYDAFDFAAHRHAKAAWRDPLSIPPSLAGSRGATSDHCRPNPLSVESYKASQFPSCLSKRFGIDGLALRRIVFRRPGAAAGGVLRSIVSIEFADDPCGRKNDAYNLSRHGRHALSHSLRNRVIDIAPLPVIPFPGGHDSRLWLRMPRSAHRHAASGRA